jgi:hypothetical protein
MTPSPPMRSAAWGWPAPGRLLSREAGGACSLGYALRRRRAPRPPFRDECWRPSGRGPRGVPTRPVASNYSWLAGAVSGARAHRHKRRLPPTVAARLPRDRGFHLIRRGSSASMGDESFRLRSPVPITIVPHGGLVPQGASRPCDTGDRMGVTSLTYDV